MYFYRLGVFDTSLEETKRLFIKICKKNPIISYDDFELEEAIQEIFASFKKPRARLFNPILKKFKSSVHLKMDKIEEQDRIELKIPDFRNRLLKLLNPIVIFQNLFKI